MREAPGVARAADWDERIFELRLARSRDDLFGMLDRVYGHCEDYPAFCDRLLAALREAWDSRSPALKLLDLKRDLEPDWFQRPDMAGYALYVDRFAGALLDLLDRMDWLERLGITYVHLMPVLKPRPGDSDGGYSVMDYRAVDPALGTMDDLEAVAGALAERGISLCIDLVLNHTAKEHEWARRARAGEARYQDYYLMWDEPETPAAYARTLHEVFPETAPGNFTWYDDLGRWVWTSFNEHQWDLNWANPEVFLEMTKVMLFLANRGVDVLRLDAVAFMWKRMGTRCQSEPEVHTLLRALRAANRIAAAATIHLEEAIVGPAEMIPYLGAGEHAGREGNLAYHNSLMVQFWSALATRDTAMMRHILATNFPPALANATYANYLRCHDDIGWAIDDGDAAAVGLSGPAHRAFLSAFYEGRFPGSFAAGLPFGVNEATGDRRVSGMTASLSGLEDALATQDADAAARAVDRILMGHALIAAYGGIPLIYMGDEIALTNDYGYRQRPGEADDSRWVHRPYMDWDRAARAEAGEGPAAQVLAGIRHVLARRRTTIELHGANPTRILDAGDPGLFALARDAPTGTLVCIFNVTEDWRGLDWAWAEAEGARLCHDALSDAPVTLYDGRIALPPYARLWLR